MNRTKNTIRILMCLVLILIFTVALASCEKIEQIFNKHEHTYTRVVTPPTCEEQGYTCQENMTTRKTRSAVRKTMRMLSPSTAKMMFICRPAAWNQM